MSLTTPAWQIVFEALTFEPDSEKLSRLAAAGPDETELLILCRDHGILLIVNNALKGVHRQFFTAEGLEQWRAAVASYTLHGLTMHRELNRLLPRFVAAGLSAVPCKGPTLSAQLYGDPVLRMFCDLDLLVPPDQVLAAVDLLIDDGYLPTFKPADLSRWLQPASHDFHCSLKHPSGDWLVEVHWALFPDWRRALPAKPKEDEWLLLGEGNTQETLLYLCVHGAKHWWWQLKWVVDVDRCVRAIPDLDWNELLKEARSRGCLRVVCLALSLARRVCGLKLPDHIEDLLQKDSTVEKLASDVTQFWPRPVVREPSLWWKTCYLLACRERFSDKLGMIVNYPIQRSFGGSRLE